MNRPKHLWQTVQVDRLERLLSGVIRSKTAMIRRMPVPGGDDDLEAVHQTVRYRNDLIPFRNRQRAAGQEIVLKIDKDEGTVGHARKSRLAKFRMVSRS
jgi:hypothetical protein